MGKKTTAVRPLHDSQRFTDKANDASTQNTDCTMAVNLRAALAEYVAMTMFGELTPTCGQSSAYVLCSRTFQALP
jgi:hypothetical protein